MSKSKMNKRDMINFLYSHFRYNTMNSWNDSTSYAKNIKLHHISFPSQEIKDRAWDLLNVEETFDGFNDILRDFAEKYKYEWQIGTNGRSGGYLVLYQGYMKKSEYQRRCRDCGQKNFQKEANKCGRCGSDDMMDFEGIETGCYGGKSTGQGMDEHDWECWSVDDLRARVKLVKDFDKTCDKAVRAFINFCKEHKAEEETVMVSKKVMVAARVARV